ncbi:MAG: hypothetical protein JSS38_14110 [Nitrospira sp.]|nr:hypothetical protein [Nitrospira sp.]
MGKKSKALHRNANDSLKDYVRTAGHLVRVRDIVVKDYHALLYSSPGGHKQREIESLRNAVRQLQSLTTDTDRDYQALSSRVNAFKSFLDEKENYYKEKKLLAILYASSLTKYKGKYANLQKKIADATALHQVNMAVLPLLANEIYTFLA